MADALLGFGMKLMVAAPITPTVADILIAEVTEVELPSFQRDAVEVTNFDSPDGIREFIVGLTNTGEFSFTMNWVPGNTTDDRMVAMSTEKVPRLFAITFPQVSGTARMSMKAFLISRQGAVPIDDRMTQAVTMKVTGPITVTE